jgi:hypothetical protein
MLMPKPSFINKFTRLTEQQRNIVRAAVATILAALIIGLTILEAKRRGMDHMVAVSVGEEIALSIALSETVYGVKLGYVGLTSVLNTLQEHWNKGGDEWNKLPVLIENFSNQQVLNEGIRAAASLAPQKIGYF